MIRGLSHGRVSLSGCSREEPWRASQLSRPRPLLIWRNRLKNSGSAMYDRPQAPSSSNCALSRRERRQWSRSGRAARHWAILTTTLAADVRDAIAGYARRAQTAKIILVDRLLPGTEFIDGQRVAAARLLERKQTTANRGNNLGFPIRHPTFCSPGGKSAIVSGEPSGPMT
jgi:hypothetical protein